MANSEIFSKLVEEYGNSDSDIESEHAVPDIRAPGSPKLMRTKSAPGKHVEDDKESVEEDLKKGPDTNNGALMQDEERVTGAVTWRIYKSYMRYAGGLYWGPWILLLLVLAQGAGGASPISLEPSPWTNSTMRELVVGNALFLGFWTAESIPGFKQGHYMAVYGSLGTL
jgi:hypothetical protein